MKLFGKDNGNWRGGRSISSHGYILIRVGVDHHLADVRGYAYEHRIVAEMVLGRPLMPGELIHHKDRNKRNNHPNNIEIVGSIGEHKAFHRKNKVLRKIHEVNPLICCKCGCATIFAKFDKSGRPRKYVVGHARRKRKERSLCL